MAIQYNIALTKDKQYYGVYVRSLSGLGLYMLADKMPELKPEQIPVYDSETGETSKGLGAIAVSSDRIGRFKRHKDAQRFIKKLYAISEQEQANKLRKRYLKPIDKDLVILKAQYNQVHRMFNGRMVKQFTTNNNTLAEQTAIAYANRGIITKLTPTVAKNTVVSKSDTLERYNAHTKKIVSPLSNGMTVKPEISKGARKGEHNPTKRTIYTKRK
jgi:hypothetical protein